VYPEPNFELFTFQYEYASKNKPTVRVLKALFPAKASTASPEKGAGGTMD